MTYFLDGRHVGKIIGDIEVEKRVDGFIGKKVIRNVVRVDAFHTRIVLMHDGVEVKECQCQWDFYGFGSSIKRQIEEIQYSIKRYKIKPNSTLKACIFTHIELDYGIIKPPSTWSIYSCDETVKEKGYLSKSSREILIYDSHNGYIYPEEKLNAYIKRRLAKEALTEELVKRHCK